MNKKHIGSVTLGLLMVIQGVSNAQEKLMKSALHVKWKIEETKPIDESSTSSFIIKNTGTKAVDIRDWSLMFNYLYPVKEDKGNTKFLVEHRNGDLYQLSFLDDSYHVIKPNDSLIVTFDAIAPLRTTSKAPGGLYFANKSGEKFDVVNYKIVEPKMDNAQMIEVLEKQYMFNQMGNAQQGQLILPTPVSLIRDSERTFLLPSKLSVQTDERFLDEAKIFVSDIKQLGWKASLSGKSKGVISIQSSQSLAADEYTLNIDGEGVVITASSATGAFYGLQSVKSLLVPHNPTKTNAFFPYLQVKDKPRYKYRGFMMDVARNFQDKKMVMKMLDAMAMYKLNVFHFHFTEDEAWRIEIPGLPELTEVGSQRSATFEDGRSLQPAYRSGAKGKGRQYYTVKDYIEILKYAKARHIEVIPEIETPGHARAAIKSMESRYNRYMKSGEQDKAEMYLLHDIADKSIYNSAQNWNDNVINAALPSTYAFIGKVLDELKKMHQQAGVELKTVHLGGDEVPAGVWEKSPKIAQLMKTANLKSVNDVWPYYIQKINNLVQERGLTMEGWEEMGMYNDGKGMGVNPQLTGKGMKLDVWNNLIGGGQEDLAYRLANEGYKVIFASASNFYLDMAWNTTFAETGLNWAAYTNLREAYTFAPENFFVNVTEIGKGRAKGAAYFKNKTKLTEIGKANFLGVKGAIWSETIGSAADMEYLVFPRFLAVAERAWSPVKSWEESASYDLKKFDKDFAEFSKKVGGVELPKLDKLNGGYAYRLPAVGVRLEGQNALVNTEYPAYQIFYTDDKSEPTLKSQPVKNGVVKLEKGKTYSFAVFASNGRKGRTYSFKYN